jgi:peptide/nickel transport system permease protein
MALTPGGPVSALAFASGMDTNQRRALEIQLGVNDPWPLQYLRWLAGDDWMRWDTDGDNIADASFLVALRGPNGEPLPPGDNRGILRGDFGRSFTLKRPVLNVLVERIPATLELSISTLIIGGLMGVIVGILAAVNHNRWFDHTTRIGAVVLDAVPLFFLALVLLIVFGARLRWVPIGDRCDTSSSIAAAAAGCPPIFQRLEFLILPVFILAMQVVGGWSRFMRASMLDVVSQDYIRTAKSKGLTERQVWFRHGARNALIPIATFLGPSITGLIAGSVAIEQIFNWPGIGRTIVSAVTGRDYPLVMAATVYAGIATILGYLLSDILYGLIDPRIRFD